MKKFDFDKKYIQIAILAFLVLVCGTLFEQVIANIEVVITNGFKAIDFVLGLVRPFLIGFVIAYFLNPMVRFIENKSFVADGNIFKTKNQKRMISIAITYIVSVFFVYLLIASILPSVIKNINTLLVTLPNNLNNIQRALEQGSVTGDNDFVNFIDAFNKLTSQNLIPYELITDALKNISDVIFNLPKIFSSVVVGVMSVANGVIDIVLGFVISIYMINDKEFFGAQCEKIISVIVKEHKAKKIFRVANLTSTTFERFVIGKSIDSLIIGTMFFVVCLSFKIPYAPLFALIIGVTNMIPYFGPFIGAVPVLIITLTWNYKMVIPLGIAILLLQQFDGIILGPKILGDSIGLKPISVIFAILIGGGLFGVPGMFLGAPAFAVIATIVDELIDKNYYD